LTPRAVRAPSRVPSGTAWLNRTSKLARRENGRGCGEKAANAASPGPAQNLCRREGPQRAANRTPSSNPTRFLCDINDLLAVQGVRSEPVSADFPVKQGKNREISRITPESGPRALHNALIFLLFLAEFPTRWNREFFGRNRELFARNRELHFPVGFRQLVRLDHRRWKAGPGSANPTPTLIQLQSTIEKRRDFCGGRSFWYGQPVSSRSTILEKRILSVLRLRPAAEKFKKCDGSGFSGTTGAPAYVVATPAQIGGRNGHPHSAMR
jgi:hypothetical protein